MNRWASWAAAGPLLVGLLPVNAAADVFKLEPVVVEGAETHPAQAGRAEVEDANNQSRTSSEASGAALQNVNPVNKRDALRYNTIGTIGEPGGGSRFGGAPKIRVFGDFSAAQSIDGLPAFRAAGQEGGGYNDTVIPSIAIDRIVVEKGGRAVGYGDGTDGGVFVTHIKSGRGYDNHQAISVDFNNADELLTQAEAADSGESWDYYIAGNFLEGRYDGNPPELDHERQYGGLAKLGFNLGDATRFEFLGIADRNQPDIFRNMVEQEITSKTYIASGYVDSRLTEVFSVRAGHQYTDTNSQWPARLRDRSIDTHITYANLYYNTDITDGIRYSGSLRGEYKWTNYLRDRIYDLEFTDISAVSTNALTFNDNLVLSAGVRQVWFENDLNINSAEQPDNLQTDSLFRYELGAAYSVLQNTRLRASIATGYNRFYSKYGNFGNDALNPAGAQDEIVESRTLEAGARQSWDGGWADIAVYNIIQENVPRRNGGAIQNVEVEQSGVEFETQHTFMDRLTLAAGYMYIWDVKATRDDGTPSGGNVFFGTNGVPVPTHQALLRLEYNIAPDWLLWGFGYFHSGYERDNFAVTDTETRDYTRFDLGLAWLPTDNLAVRTRIENIFDERDLGQTLEGAPVADAGKIGRVVWVGFDYTF
jgi:outer membrane receptor protein involved in Fe transport